MRPIALVPILLVVSCATDPIHFSGRDLLDESSGLKVTARKADSHILVTNVKYGCAVPLPYSEDWVFDPSPKKPIFGSSTALLMAVTVQMFQPGVKVDEETYLRTEYLANIQRNCDNEGLPLLDINISKSGDATPSEHPVLEYRHEIPKGNGEILRQVHFWSFRQRADNLIYEIHLSKSYQDPAKLPSIRAVAHIALGRKFMISNQ
jgi:hypothetical protein